MYNLVFQRGIGTRYQIANIHWVMEKLREFQKNKYFCLTAYAKALDYVDYNKLKNTRDGSIRLPYLSSEKPEKMQVKKQVRIGNGTTDWFNIGKGVQGFILSPFLFKLYERTLCKMPGWMNHKLESLLGEISTTSDLRWYQSNNTERRTKELLDEGERGKWKS